MVDFDKISQELNSLGFSNYDEIVKTFLPATTGDSITMGTKIMVDYANNPGIEEDLYILFFVKDQEDTLNAHIYFVVATYYANGKALFNKMYSASMEKIPSKALLIEQMKNVLYGKHNARAPSTTGDRQKLPIKRNHR